MNSCGDKKQQKEDVSQNPTEIKAIKEILNAQKECWNNGDIDGFMEGYWNSEELIFTSLSHEPAFGWKNTLERYKNSYPTKESMGELKLEFLDLKLISKNTASLKGKWELIRESDNPNGLFWLYLQKFDEKWLITKDSTISFEINIPLSLLECDNNNPS
jgi:hypothetical protein